MNIAATPQKKNLPLYWLGIPVLLVGTVVLIATFVEYSAHQQVVSNAITIDLVFTVPVVYWLIVRRTKIPTTTTVPIFVAGIIIAGTILAPSDRALLVQIRTWVLPAVELSVVLFVVRKVQLLKRQYQIERDQERDLFSLLKRAASEVVPDRLAHLLATEISVFYYLLFSWKKPVLAKTDFTVHRKSGTVPILAVLILMIAVEATALHIFLAIWYPLVAWVFTGLSIYTALQVAGMAKSLTRRFVTIQQRQISLRYGILAEALIPAEYLKSFGPTTATVDEESGGVYLSPLSALEKPNFVIHLNSPLVMMGLYGKQQAYSSIAFHVDNPSGLNEALAKLDV